MTAPATSEPMQPRWKRLYHDVRRCAFDIIRRRPLRIVEVAAAGLMLAAAALFIVLADEITEGESFRFDAELLKAFRDANDPARTIGPRWLEDVMLDATALGSGLVLSIIVAVSAGFLYMEKQRRVATLMLATTMSGALLSIFLKWVFARPRPIVVPHLRHVTSMSFPSGHAMASAVVYLTLGVMFMKAVSSRRAKAFCMVVAISLTLLIGFTRVFLGVHYPSDVLGGWLAGCAWASLAWIVGQFIPSRPIAERSDEPVKNSHDHENTGA
ncbi:MAG: phosphatase PAP2 family protein [Pirellulales bacterium]